MLGRTPDQANCMLRGFLLRSNTTLQAFAWHCDNTNVSNPITPTLRPLSLAMQVSVQQRAGGRRVIQNTRRSDV